MNPKNLKFYVSNELYFIVDQYQRDTCFYDEDAYYYYYYDIDVDRTSLCKEHFLTTNILLGIIIQIKWIFYHCN